MEFSHKVLRAGQPRPYADSVFEAEVLGPAEATEEEVVAYCQTVRVSHPQSERTGDNWHWPFYELRKVENGKWRYIVREEFTD